ncbi:2-dehydro-3-deoxyphosphooctonate aldolase [Flavobacterium terrisoli]|uniref:2-dehydro-3-deoxyphosphooctonate aldolase n=1 Tax=Flavobacterium terrisoli TaxID=3242195 RepID=UPI002542D3BF|nr:2-dehydro-3-deoxyphosphooctonate aldolase [Flavobacterium buctense]
MKTYLSLFLVLFLSCDNKQKQLEKAVLEKEEKIELDYFHLTNQSSDKSYGFTEANPIKVGGSSESMGPKNERRFLSALKGPHGEKVRFYRDGSCCLFETPNVEKGMKGMLDIYKVYWDDIADTLQIYINMYDRDSLLIPVGLTSKN